MSAVQSVSAEVRDRAGKGAARATRRAGRVPAVIYGDKKEATMISLDPKEIDKHIHTKGFFATLLDVEVAGKKQRVLPRDVQFDVVTDRTLHVDFQRVSKDTKIHDNVPVVIRNETAAPGVKKGGVINIVRHEIEFICSPDAIPQMIEIDMTGLDIGASVHISSVKLPEGATPVIRERDFTIVTLAAPSAMKSEAEDAPAAAATAAAPAAGAAAAAPAKGAAAAAPAKGAAAAAPAKAAAPAPKKK